jgi:large subunit ribosomal protein L9
MKVILIENIEDLGKKHDIKNVNPGYARNYLFPNNLARPATKEALEWLEAQSQEIQKKQEEDLKKTQSIVSKIDGLEINLVLKVGEKGQLFESVNEQKIKEALKQEANIEVSKKQIKIKEAIKETGEFPIKVSFPHNLEASIKIIITEEEK